ncbi:MAG: hypothetical protein WBN86_09070 [Porticoccaceae bacterium]
MTVFALDQDAAHGAVVADPERSLAAGQLGRVRVREIRPMALAGVDDQYPGAAGRGQQALAGGDGAAQQRHVVAQHGAKLLLERHIRKSADVAKAITLTQLAQQRIRAQAKR